MTKTNLAEKLAAIQNAIEDARTSIEAAFYSFDKAQHLLDGLRADVQKKEEEPARNWVFPKHKKGLETAPIFKKQKETPNEKLSGFPLDDSAQAIKIAMDFVRLASPTNQTIIKFLQGKMEGLSLTRIHKKYGLNYTTIKKLDENL